MDRKVRRVREVLGFSRGSHGGRDLMAFLETFPRDELFAIDADELTTIAEAALNLKERRATRLFIRRDTYERFLSCLVYLPRDRYTTDVRLQIQQVLMDAVGGASVDYTARVTESVLARLHIVVRMARGQSVPEVDAEALEARIAEVVLSWDDELSWPWWPPPRRPRRTPCSAGTRRGSRRPTGRSRPPRRRWPTCPRSSS